MKVWIAHEKGRELLGELPAGVEVEVCEDAATLPSDPADVKFWVPPFSAKVQASDLLPQLTGLEVVQLLSAGADNWVGRVPSPVQLCDARGVHDASVSEWVLGAAIGSLRQFPAFARAQERQEWTPGAFTPTPELTGKRVLIVGAGSIGRAIEQRLAPFEVTVTRVARTARPEHDVHAVDELPVLLPYAEVVVLVVPLTEQTRGLVDASFLAALPDGALVVNAARGPVVDTDALVTELASGRISAALDVTDPEPLPAGHPLWQLPNVFITPHTGGAVLGLLPRAYGLAGAQLRRFAAGETLVNRVVDGY
ncbi:2-hydroxyacid dehydrogenase [Actinoplanes friuliensis]|uniref:D-isomer specific 2-hydroxyacid dehydrogenase nad-binding protein n=1 Tax=Actinoplanes friuliensis DSM 7358 TaxID=1246995 RepID=U5WCC1_9ACTN|nr:2-hydroxyacid dehydrogenase [Actinoplanes friuliensis]AGZ45645.1 d-isomer specific 2-hydroxyacid dehydrogenase nad-binding protein [Actinoplanes friuliensis DSM 7358]